MRLPRFHDGEAAMWNDGMQDIPVVIDGPRRRNACSIYYRVRYVCADGTEARDGVHPSQLRPLRLR